MSKKLIIFRVGSFPLKSETFVTNQIIIAINLGYEVSILASKKNDIESSSQKELIQQYNLLERTTELKIVRVKGKLDRVTKILKLMTKGTPAGAIGTFNYFKYGSDGLRGDLFFQMYELKDYLNADVFHIQFGDNMYPLDSLKHHKLLNAKILTTFHGYDAHYNNSNKQERVSYYRYLFSSCDLFTANTIYLAKQLEGLNCPKERLEIIPIPINTEFFKPKKVKAKKDGVIRIISVGRLIKWKGHELGVRAVSGVINRNINVEYHLIGEGEERYNLIHLINKLGIQKHVSLHGAQPQSVILSLMQSSDIFLMTSTFDETGRRETQGVVIGEAQACGLPVVAFRSGGVPYAIIEGETGLLSAENDYKGLAEDLEKLILDDNARIEMGKNGRRFVKDSYSQKVVSSVWEKTYKRLIDS